MKKILFSLTILVLVFASACGKVEDVKQDVSQTSAKEEITPPSNEVEISAEIGEEETMASSYVSFKMNGEERKFTKLEYSSMVANSGNYNEIGEYNFSFSGGDESGTEWSAVYGLTFPAEKKVAKYISVKDRTPFMDPVINLQWNNIKDSTSKSIMNTTEVEGTPFDLEITRFDDEKIEGKFAGSLFELGSEGFMKDSKYEITDGLFSIDLKTTAISSL